MLMNCWIGAQMMMMMPNLIHCNVGFVMRRCGMDARFHAQSHNNNDNNHTVPHE